MYGFGWKGGLDLRGVPLSYSRIYHLSLLIFFYSSQGDERAKIAWETG